MANTINEQTVDEITSIEISDESLEVAASAGNAGAYTQFGLCTVSFCPGVKRKNTGFFDGDRRGFAAPDESARCRK